MALTIETLESAFRVYFDEFDRCKKGGAYWALMNFLVSMPEICSALESPKGDTGDYCQWCDDYLNPACGGVVMSGEEWKGLRNKLLHQGVTKPTRRGNNVSYGQPGSMNGKTHKQVDGGVLYLNVHDFADEMCRAMRLWFDEIVKGKKSKDSDVVARVKSNIALLARYQPLPSSSAPDTKRTALGTHGVTFGNQGINPSNLIPPANTSSQQPPHF